jgi:hypothetical protein
LGFPADLPSVHITYGQLTVDELGKKHVLFTEFTSLFN